jgi:hypothetical protein
MIADCETCDRKQVPCKSCQESQRAICYRCDGDADDPYCEIARCDDCGAEWVSSGAGEIHQHTCPRRYALVSR